MTVTGKVVVKVTVCTLVVYETVVEEETWVQAVILVLVIVFIDVDPVATQEQMRSTRDWAIFKRCAKSFLS